LFYEIGEIPPSPDLETLKEILAELPEMNLVTGPWIAGGAARRLLQGSSLQDGGADVDFFFPTQQSWRAFDAILKKYPVIHESSRATLYDVKGLKIQIIQRRFYDTINEVFRDFDFAVCQIATDGKNLAYTKQAYENITTGTLSMAIQGIVSSSTMISRMTKYINYGFLPVPGLHAELVKNGLANIGPWHIFEQQESYYDSDTDAEDTEYVETKDMNSEFLRKIAKKLGLDIVND
jgi:hypothetical protein